MNYFLQVVTALLFFVTAVKSARTEHNQMVTMSKAELMEIVNCISKSQNQAACDRLAVCNTMMPKQVSDAYEICNKEINPNGKWKCNKTERLYTSEDIPSKIFDCINAKTKKLNAGESRKMIEFETCARALYIGACPAPKRV